MAPAMALGAPGARPVTAPTCRRGTAKATTPAPPSEALRNTFGILRSEPDDDDALSPRALKALKQRGLAPVDLRSARLLRADRRKRTWVVAVADVDAVGGRACPPGYALTANAKPREGLAVVAVEGAPAGGGGSLHELRRGLAPAAVDPCAGADRKMLGVSGIVPDGVEAVFATAADGTATRADVRDNGYTFVLPRPRLPETRYLVWTGADGTPHVQPLPAVLAVLGRGGACPQVETPPRVTPDPFAASCGRSPLRSLLAGPPAAVLQAPRPLPPRSRPRPRRPQGAPRAAPRPSSALIAPFAAGGSALGTCSAIFAPGAVMELPPVQARPAPRPAVPRPRPGP
jgi:hypothetical protein